MLRIAVPHHREDVQQEWSEVYAFKKAYDAPQKRWRLDAFPLSERDTTPGWDIDVAPTSLSKQPFIMIAEQGELYVVQEEHSESAEEDNVRCRRYKMRFEPMDLLKDATYETLTFEQNRLCHKYTDLNIQHTRDEETQCKIDYSSLYLNAFTHEPVEMFVEGRYKRRRHRGGDIAANTHEARFWVNVLVKEFEFELPRKQEKQMFTLPKDLKKECKEGREGDLSIEVEALMSAIL